MNDISYLAECNSAPLDMNAIEKEASLLTSNLIETIDWEEFCEGITENFKEEQDKLLSSFKSGDDAEVGFLVRQMLRQYFHGVAIIRRLNGVPFHAVWDGKHIKERKRDALTSLAERFQVTL